MMLARHAECLFWAGRYVERAQDTIRMLDVTYHEQIESGPVVARRAWAELLQVLYLEQAFEASGRTLDAQAVNQFLVLDDANPSAVVTAVYRARENARSVRELLSTELFEAFNACHLGLQSRELARELDEHPGELYGFVKRSCQTIVGVAAETLSRDERWRFLMLGVLIERAEMTCRLLEVHARRLVAGSAGPGSANPGSVTWMRVLESASAAEAFVRDHSTTAGTREALSFLLMSRTFPRSVLYSLQQAEEHLVALEASNQSSEPLRLLGRVRADLEYRDVDELVRGDVAGFLDSLQQRLIRGADAVANRFFRHSGDWGLHLQEFRGDPGVDVAHPGGLR